jgi:hypothetical protein
MIWRLAVKHLMRSGLIVEAKASYALNVAP